MMTQGILAFALGIFMVHASAFADCGSFDQLLSQSAALQAPFGDLDHPQCNGKPNEAVIDNLISCFEGLTGQSPRQASEGDLQLSSLYGIITQCYRSGMGQQAPGKKSFDDLANATIADPTYETAWLSFADVVAGMKGDSFLQRQEIQLGLGISIDDELQDAIQGLSALPQDTAVAAELAKLKSLQ